MKSAGESGRKRERRRESQRERERERKSSRWAVFPVVHTGETKKSRLSSESRRAAAIYEELTRHRWTRCPCFPDTRIVSFLSLSLSPWNFTSAIIIFHSDLWTKLRAWKWVTWEPMDGLVHPRFDRFFVLCLSWENERKRERRGKKWKTQRRGGEGNVGVSSVVLNKHRRNCAFRCAIVNLLEKFN